MSKKLVDKKSKKRSRGLKREPVTNKQIDEKLIEGKESLLNLITQGNIEYLCFMLILEYEDGEEVLNKWVYRPLVDEKDKYYGN